MGKLSFTTSFCITLLANCAWGNDFACDSTADKLWGEETMGLSTCPGPNNTTLLEVVGLANLTKIAKNFGQKPFTPKELKCMLDVTGPYPAVANNLDTCLSLLAPLPSAPNEDRLMASMGASVSSDGSGRVVSNCRPGEPCKEFNKFLVNGTLLKAAFKCGVVTKIGKALGTRAFLTTAKLSKAMQGSASGLSDQCFCSLSNGDGARGPIYGPIFYANAALAYMAGGLDRLGLLPGCRALCAPGTECAPQ